MNELLVYTELCGGKYRIEEALGCDDTSCTYLASDSDGKNFVIKEFFVSDMCSRNGNEMLVSDGADSVYIDELRSRFRDFSVALMGLHYPSLVPVVDCFSENNTCYFVMEHIKGKTLRSFSPMTKTEALPVITDMIEAVKFLHDHKIPHLNLSPDNIIRRESGARPYLVADTDSAVWILNRIWRTPISCLSRQSLSVMNHLIPSGISTRWEHCIIICCWARCPAITTCLLVVSRTMSSDPKT